jgi:hypothetical protein
MWFNRSVAKQYFLHLIEAILYILFRSLFIFIVQDTAGYRYIVKTIRAEVSVSSRFISFTAEKWQSQYGSFPVASTVERDSATLYQLEL